MRERGGRSGEEEAEREPEEVLLFADEAAVGLKYISRMRKDGGREAQMTALSHTHTQGKEVRCETQHNSTQHTR